MLLFFFKDFALINHVTELEHFQRLNYILLFVVCTYIEYDDKNIPYLMKGLVTVKLKRSNYLDYIIDALKSRGIQVKQREHHEIRVNLRAYEITEHHNNIEEALKDIHLNYTPEEEEEEESRP